MNMHPTPLGAFCRGVSTFDTPEKLSAIHDTDCAAVVWRRAPMASFQSWIDALPPEHLPRARVTLHRDRVRLALSDIARAYETPDCTEREVLLDDIAAMAALFADVMDVHYLRLRLDAVTTNACRKFHVDALRARLVCTYRGRGTEYGLSESDADPAQIFSVPTASPIVMRGTLWPPQPNSALRHRSPPIEGTGATRLVLVLDPIFDADAPGFDEAAAPQQTYTH